VDKKGEPCTTLDCCLNNDVVAMVGTGQENNSSFNRSFSRCLGMTSSHQPMYWFVRALALLLASIKSNLGLKVSPSAAFLALL
jgi:hypothetical protein